MATCYLCAANRAPTEEPAAIACCTQCGMFFCRWDGARRHGTGHFYCAVCLVPMLLRAAGIDPGNWPEDGDGGGGTGASYAAMREELSVDEFERFCADLSDASKPYQLKWRALLGDLDRSVAAATVAERIGDFAGGRENVENAYLKAASVDSEGAATAVGVAETAARAEADLPGELTMPGSRATETSATGLHRKEVQEREQQLATEAQRQQAHREQRRKVQTQQPAKKVRYMGQ